jgi:adenylate cyclase
VSDQPIAQRVEELLLGGERRYTRAEVTERSGVPEERARELWHSLGFAAVTDDERMFTDGDLRALTTANELIQAGITDPAQATSMARMLGQHMSRLAESQVAVLRDILLANPELAADERQLTRFVERLVPDLEQLQNHVWRRHLAAYSGRALVTQDDDLEGRSQVVGFADMVGFTTLTRRSTEDELVSVVDRFDALTAEVVAENHGRIVKMIGDEVLFVADSPEHGAEIALILLERAEQDEALPSLRAGLAYGRVLSRFGDIYGSVVNLAARLASIARPGSVLIDRALAHALEQHSDYTIRHRRPVSVRGYARLRPAVLRRAGAEQPSLLEAAQSAAAELLGFAAEDADGVPHLPLEPDDTPSRARSRRR